MLPGKAQEIKVRDPCGHLMLHERGGWLAITPSPQVPSCSASTGGASILLRVPGPQHGPQRDGVQMITSTQEQFKPISFTAMVLIKIKQAPSATAEFSEEDVHFCIPKRCLQSPSPGTSSQSRFSTNLRKRRDRMASWDEHSFFHLCLSLQPREPDPPTQGGILLETQRVPRSEGSRLKHGSTVILPTEIIYRKQPEILLSAPQLSHFQAHLCTLNILSNSPWLIRCKRSSPSTARGVTFALCKMGIRP